jgi:hypothetical protein
VAQNFLETSRTKWAEAAARDAKTRADFIERMRNGARPQPPGFKPGTPNQSAQPGADASAWMRDERMKAMKQDEETVKSLRSMLGAEEAARFDKFNRVRSIATPGATATPPNGTANPLNVSVPPASKPNNAIPVP